MTDQTLKDIDRAFKALEERDELLDKIESEIEHVKDNPLFGMVSNDIILEVILEIIDKYRKGAENE